MALESLSIRNLRNIQSADAGFSPHINLIAGMNASGKTTVLEAIQLLSSARSFRSRHWQEYITHGQETLLLKGKVTASSLENHLEVRRRGTDVQISINGEKVSRVSRLAVCLPTQLIHPDSHQLISGGPKIRRKFLDWGLFHVEPRFIEHWKRYEQALKQRNALLRQRSGLSANWLKTINAWNPELEAAAVLLNQLRESYIGTLNEVLPKYIATIVGDHQSLVDYSPGWDINLSLSSQYERMLERDRSRGFTHYGPHRADLTVLFDGHLAKSVLSRGQQKMLVIAMLIAQLEIFNRFTNQRSVLLIDDLGAELDANHCRRLLDLLAKQPVQLFITSTNAEILQGTHWPDKKIFQISAGRLQEVL